MSDRDRIARMLVEREFPPLPQVTVNTVGNMRYPELGARLNVPFAGGEIGVDARYLHDRQMPEGSAMLNYRRRF